MLELTTWAMFKGAMQFLAVRHRATHRIPLCCPILNTLPLVTGLIAGLRSANKTLQSSSLSKEIPSSVVAGGLAGFPARLW